MQAVPPHLGGHDGERPPCPPAQPAHEREIDVLDSAFAEVLGGKPAAVIVAGARGAGKSALLSRFLDLVKDDATVLSGRCDAREQLGYQAVDEILDGLSRHLARLPREDLREISPPDAALLGLAFPALRAAWPPSPGEAGRPSRTARAPSRPSARCSAGSPPCGRWCSPSMTWTRPTPIAWRCSPRCCARRTRQPLLFLATTRTGAEGRACEPLPWPARRVLLGETDLPARSRRALVSA